MFKKILAIVLSLSLVLGLAVVAGASVGSEEIALKEKTATKYVFELGSTITEYYNYGAEIRFYTDSTMGTLIPVDVSQDKTTATISISDVTGSSVYWMDYHSEYGIIFSGTADLVIPAPALTADTTHNTADKDGLLTDNLVITFSDSEAWRNAITAVKYKTAKGVETTLTSQQYTVSEGQISIDKNFRTWEGSTDLDYGQIIVSAEGYKDASVWQYVYPTTIKFTATVDAEKKYIDSDIVVHLAYDEADSALVAEWVTKVTGLKYSNEAITMKSILDDTDNNQVDITIDGTEFSSARSYSIQIQTEGTKIASKFGYLYGSFTATIEAVGDIPAFYLANNDNFFYGDDVIITYPESSKDAYNLWEKAFTGASIYVPGYGTTDVTNAVVIDKDSKTIIVPASAYTSLFQQGEQYSFYVYLDATGYGETGVYASFVSGKAAPVVTPQENAVKNEAATLSFTDNAEWRNAITKITVRNPYWSKSWPVVEDVVSEGLITIPASTITLEGEYVITIEATNYKNVEVHLGVGAANQNLNQSNYDTTTSLKVVNGETTVELSAYDLYSIMFAEGAKNYTYSVCNTWPTFEIYTRANGPTIKGIFEKAGVDVNALDGDQLVLFTAADGYKVAVKVSELLSEDRYYYPNGGLAQEGGFTGSSETAYLDAVQVPAILQLNHDNGTLRFGQADPQDQQKDSSVRYMVSTSTPGTIEILSDKAAKFDAPEISADGCEAVGTSVGFSFNKTGFVAGTYQRAAIYYTYSTNGVAPEDPIDENGKLSANAILFNYAQYKNEDGQDVYNYLTVDSTDVIVKAVVVGRDHIASDIVTYEFDHSYSEDWTYDQYFHWHESTCEHYGEIANYGMHNWDDGVEIEKATATETGLDLYTCEDCGATKTVTTYGINFGSARINEFFRQLLQGFADFFSWLGSSLANIF